MNVVIDGIKYVPAKEIVANRDKSREILAKVCRYLLSQPNLALPASLWNEMLDEVPEEWRELGDKTT